MKLNARYAEIFNVKDFQFIQPTEHVGEIFMSPFVSKITLTIFFLSIAGLYHATFMPFGWNYCGAVVTTGFFGLLIVAAIEQAVRLWSPINTLNALSSLVIGFGVSAFLSFCSKEIFPPLSLPHGVSSFFHFLFPFALVILSFNSLKALSFFRSSESPTSDTVHGEIPGSRKFIPDQSVLEDGRVVDLARTGLLDGQIVVPSFLPRELKNWSELGEETSKARARKALEALRRLESLPRLGIQFKEVSVPETAELNEKIVHSAKLLNASLLTNENSPLRSESEQGLYLAIDTIANSLRPPIPKGELLSIKIQRLGKEPKQGIGYLEDGTMVVVNGGGDFLGKNVRTQVLSQKYASSGKIVFCNVREEDSDDRSMISYGQADISYCSPSS